MQAADVQVESLAQHTLDPLTAAEPRLNGSFFNFDRDGAVKRNLVELLDAGEKGCHNQAGDGDDPCVVSEDEHGSYQKGLEEALMCATKNRAQGQGLPGEPPAKKARYADDSDSAEEEKYRYNSRALKRTKSKTLKKQKKRTAAPCGASLNASERVKLGQRALVAPNPEAAAPEVNEPNPLQPAPPGQPPDAVLAGGPVRVKRERADGDAPLRAKGEEQEQEQEHESVAGSAQEPSCYREDAKNAVSAQKLFYRHPGPHGGPRGETVRDTFERYLHGSSGDPRDCVHIRNLFALAPQTTAPPHALPVLEKYLSVMDVWRRREEERDLLREPTGHERPCVNGKNCEGTMIPGAKKVVLKEACSHAEVQEFYRTGQWPEARRPCRMCARRAINQDYYNTRANGECIRPDAVLHTFCNIVNAEGEYSAQDVIMASSTAYHGVIAPVPIHCRLWYRQRVGEDGLLYYEQPGYAKPASDGVAVFRLPPVPGPAGKPPRQSGAM